MRDWNAGKPASQNAEADGRQGADEAEGMAEAVDPTAAAPARRASDYSDTLSTAMDIAYCADTPIDLRCVATLGFSPGRWVVYRARSGSV
eukprot:6120198-Pyramimonas_sp.AAC.1